MQTRHHGTVLKNTALACWDHLRAATGAIVGAMLIVTVVMLSLPTIVSGQADTGQAIGNTLRDAALQSIFGQSSSGAQKHTVMWCDSIVVSAIAGDRRQIPIVACSATPSESLAVRRAITSVTKALTVYGTLTGVPYPWPRYDMTIEPDHDGQMGGQATGRGTMRYTGPLPDARSERDRPDVSAKILVHELAHQWFTEYVEAKGHSGWLFEGFADFMTAQAWAATHGMRAEEELLFFYNTGWSQANHVDSSLFLGSYAPTELSSIPWPGAMIWDGPLDSDNDLYYRGALTLWMLKQYLGDARFWASAKTYLTENAHKTADATDFLRAIQTATGEDLTWFFTQWVYGRGYPRVTVSSEYDAPAHRVTLQVAQDTAAFHMPVFRLPVTIRVGTAHGDITTRVVVDSAHQILVINDVRSAPTSVVFDDADAIVKTLQFTQPTAWLVTQLQQERTPWQTWWTIAQLRARAATDPVAVRALIAAVERGTYPLTRAQAAAALDSVTTAQAMATLSHALHDTAILVQRGAVHALGGHRTPAAHAALMAAFQHQTSDIVRVDALTALLGDSTRSVADQHALLTDALRQSSYRDAIRVRAILSAIGPQFQCDTAKAAILRTMVHDPIVGKSVLRAVSTINQRSMGMISCFNAIASGSR